MVPTPPIYSAKDCFFSKLKFNLLKRGDLSAIDLLPQGMMIMAVSLTEHLSFLVSLLY